MPSFSEPSPAASPFHPLDPDPSKETSSSSSSSSSSSRNGNYFFKEGGFWDRAFANTFSMDRRSVALFRILLGLVTLYDLADRSHDLRAHYSDAGALPRYVAMEAYSGFFQFSFHAISGTVTFAALIFLFHAIVAMLLVVGYRSRTMAFLNWVLINSLIARNAPVTHGGDNYLKMINFYAIFLPLGSCFSVDALLAKDYRLGVSKRGAASGRSPYAFYSAATLAYALQISIIYVMGFFLKKGDEWVVDRTATFFALSLSFFRRPLGDFLLQFPGLLKVFTVAVLWWEGVGPLLFFSPILHGPLRTLGAVGFTFLHVGFGSCMRLDSFIYTGMSAPLALLPSWFWDSLLFPILFKQTSLYRRQSSHAVYSFVGSSLPMTKGRTLRIFVDPSHNHLVFLAKCLNSFFFFPDTLEVQPIEKLPGTEQFANSVQTDERRAVKSRWSENPSDTTDHSSISGRDFPRSVAWVVIDVDGQQQTGFSAVLSIFKASPVLFLFASFLRSSGFRSVLLRCYHFIQNRFSSVGAGRRRTNHTLFSRGECKRERSKLRKGLMNGFVLFTVVFLLYWNLNTLHLVNSRFYPDWIREYGVALQLAQGWSMFAPHPPHSEFYYVIDGELDGGERVEVWNNEGIFNWQKQNVSFDPPDPFYRPFYNHRWFKYYETMNRAEPNFDSHPLRLAFGRYICREWNRRYTGQDRLYTFTIYYMWREWFLNASYSAPRKEVIWGHLCYEKPAPNKTENGSDMPIEETESDPLAHLKSDASLPPLPPDLAGYEGYEDLWGEAEEQATEEQGGQEPNGIDIDGPPARGGEQEAWGNVQLRARGEGDGESKEAPQKEESEPEQPREGTPQ